VGYGYGLKRGALGIIEVKYSSLNWYGDLEIFMTVYASENE